MPRYLFGKIVQITSCSGDDLWSVGDSIGLFRRRCQVSSPTVVVDSRGEVCILDVVDIEQWGECCFDFLLGNSPWSPQLVGSLSLKQSMKYPPFLVKTLAISCAKEILSLSVKLWNNPESIALSKLPLWNSSESAFASRKSIFDFLSSAFAFAATIARVDRSTPTTENPFCAR